MVSSPSSVFTKPLWLRRCRCRTAASLFLVSFIPRHSLVISTLTAGVRSKESRGRPTLPLTNGRILRSIACIPHSFEQYLERGGNAALQQASAESGYGWLNPFAHLTRQLVFREGSTTSEMGVRMLFEWINSITFTTVGAIEMFQKISVKVLHAQTGWMEPFVTTVT